MFHLDYWITESMIEHHLSHNIGSYELQPAGEFCCSVLFRGTEGISSFSSNRHKMEEHCAL